MLPVVRHAAMNTLNLVVVGTAGVAAAALHSVPVLMLGGAAYAALIAWDAMSPAFQKKVRSSGQREEVELASLVSHPDPRARFFAEALIEERGLRAKALGEVPAAAEEFIEASMAQVPDLEAHAKVLIERLAAVREHLAADSPASVLEAAESLTRKASQVSDDETREQLTQAAQAKRSQLGTLQDLQRTVDRIEAHLTNILTVLEGVPAKLLHMRTLDDSNRDSFGRDIKGDLARLNAELAAFEETLKPVEFRSHA